MKITVKFTHKEADSGTKESSGSHLISVH